MVSKARLDLPEPDSPVITIRLSRGSSRDTFLRLWTRAPCTPMVVRAVIAGLRLAGIGGPHGIEECQLLHVHIAPPGQAHGQRRLSKQSLVCQVLAGAGHALDAEVAAEVVLDFGGGA